MQSAIDRYMKSPAGQKKLKDTLDHYRKSGVGKTSAGSKLVTKEVLEQMKKRMIELVFEEADKSHRYVEGRLRTGLPPSLWRDIHSLRMTGAYESGDSYVLNFYFTHDLYRSSLKDKNGNSRYGGIDNIIALFNNGYYTPNQTGGFWDSEDANYDLTYGSNYAYGAKVISRNIMPANEFMQSAAARLMQEFADYGVRVELNAAYTEGPGVYY